MNNILNDNFLLKLKNKENLDHYSNEDLLAILIQISNWLGRWESFLCKLEWNNPHLLSYQQKVQTLGLIQNKIKIELLNRLKNKGIANKMWNEIKAIYLLQQRADIYSEVFETLVTNILNVMKTTTDENTKKELQNLLYSMEQYTDKIQKNISEYKKIVENKKD